MEAALGHSVLRFRRVTKIQMSNSSEKRSDEGSTSGSTSSGGQGGRPKKDPADRRTNSHGVYLSDKEKEQLEKNAEAAGLSVNEYIRRKTLGGEAVQAKADEATRRELRAIGNNLNQLTRRAHESGIGKVEAQLEYAIAELRDALGELRQ